MDPSSSSEPVAVEAPAAVEDNNGAAVVNGNGAAADNNNAGEDGSKNYEDLFPSLPASAAPAAGQGNPIGAWNGRPKLQSSTITQVRTRILL